MAVSVPSAILSSPITKFIPFWVERQFSESSNSASKIYVSASNQVETVFLSFIFPESPLGGGLTLESAESTLGNFWNYLVGDINSVLEQAYGADGLGFNPVTNQFIYIDENGNPTNHKSITGGSTLRQYSLYGLNTHICIFAPGSVGGELYRFGVKQLVQITYNPSTANPER